MTTEVAGSHRVRLFLGNDLVGVAAVFSNPSTPLSTPNNQINASIPLTPALVEKNVGLNPEQTIPVLANELRWVVERSNDEGTGFVAASSPGSLTVSVISNEANYPADKSELPSKGAPVTYVEPTEGKEGGLQPGEQPPVGGEIESVNGTATRYTRLRKARLL